MIIKVPVEVTEEDITGGVRASACVCPIALALHRQGFRGHVVGDKDVIADYAGNEAIVRYDLPSSAQRFIKKFDTRRRVEPFSFEMTLAEIWDAKEDGPSGVFSDADLS